MMRIMKKMSNEEREEAEYKAAGLPPFKEELGGDIYYRCGYYPCRSIVKRLDNYCKECGMKILFEE